MTDVSLESIGATDWFAVNLTAGTTYTFTETGLTAETQIFVLPASAAIDASLMIDAGVAGLFPTGQTRGATLTADTTGVYYLGINDLTAATGPYTLSAAVVANSYTLAHPGLLTLGAPLNASLESAGDTNWFKIGLTAGTTYIFTETGLTDQTSLLVVPQSAAADVSLSINAGSVGTVVTGQTQSATFTADTTGFYYVEINDLTAATGAYALSAAVATDSYTLANPRPFAVGGQVSASLESVGATDWFRVNLTAGTTYTFTESGLTAQAYLAVLPAGAAADTSLLVNAASAGTFPAGLTQRATFTAQTTGSYYVEVSDPTGATGAFTLSAAAAANSYTRSHPGALTVGAPVNASLESVGDTNWFSIDLTAGVTYSFTETGLTAEANVLVLPQSAAADTAVALNPAVVGAFAAGQTEGATFTADSTGAYLVEVNDIAGATGAYALSAAVVADSYTLASPGALTVGGQVGASLQSAGAADWFRVNLTQGVTYTFTETGLTAQTTIAVLSGAPTDPVLPVNASVVVAASAGQTQTATFTADATAAYYVEINDITGATGSYTLAAAVAADSYTLAHPGALAVPASFTGADNFLAHGKSDFLIENGAGAIVVGEVTGGQAGYTQVAALGPEWSFRGSGDFLGDGKSDFLIENGVGAVVVGEVTAGQASYTLVSGLGPEWSFKGVGDFLGDGKSDFLIENSVGAVVVGEVANGQAGYSQVAGLGPEWSFVATGDFLGHGKSDFLIENAGGAIVAAEVTGGQASYTQIAALGPEWAFKGAGDFLGEGHDQFLIQNTAGAVVAGDYTGGQIHYTQLTALGPEWAFRGVGDYLGEGHDQFLMENGVGAVVAGDYTGGQIHFTQVAGLGSEWVFH